MSGKWGEFWVPKRHDLMCTAMRTVEWKIKSEANYSWTESTVIQTSWSVLFGEKPYCSVLKCSKFKLIGKCYCNNSRHLHYRCKNTEESFSDRHAVKQRLNWWKNYGRIIFNKNSFPGLLMGKFVWNWSALLLDFIFFPLHWSGTWLPGKNFMLSDICHIYFHIMSIGSCLWSIRGQTHEWCHCYNAIAIVCHFFVLTTFWHHLWSITERTHSNMESIC